MSSTESRSIKSRPIESSQFADGQVDRIVRIIGTSSVSWEEAARSAVEEAAKTIHDLRYARVAEQDMLVRESIAHYRVKLELAFQLDRNRVDRRGLVVQVRRVLIIANQTLAGPNLHAVVRERMTESTCEFHVLVPEPSPTAVFVDPATGLLDSVSGHGHDARAIARQGAGRRLETFRDLFDDLDTRVTGEVALGDPIVATHRVMARSAFDEIIVSTLPSNVSRWLKLDLPNRLERTFDLPVTRVVAAESSR